MKYLVPVLTLITATATAAHAHEGGHIHPHTAYGWMFAALLMTLGLAGGYLIGRGHK